MAKITAIQLAIAKSLDTIERNLCEKIYFHWCRSKLSVQFRGPVWHFWTPLFLQCEVVSLTSHPQAGGPLLVGCPWLLIQYNTSIDVGEKLFLVIDRQISGLIPEFWRGCSSNGKLFHGMFGSGVLVVFVHFPFSFVLGAVFCSPQVRERPPIISVFLHLLHILFLNPLHRDKWKIKMMH